VDAQARVVELEAENVALRELNVVLSERVAALETELRVVLGQVAELEKRLGRNSSNSSKPPSSDDGRSRSVRRENANRAARRALGRRQGKQPGTPGSTLSQVSVPDEVVVHAPDRCGACDRDLGEAPVVDTVVRQVFDIPVPRVVVTEHRAHKHRCACGNITVGEFPDGVSAPAVYGPGIKAHAVYLLCAQHVPRERCAEALAEMFGVSVSTGTLDNWLTEATGALDPFKTAVCDRLRGEPVVHADETSVRSGKKALWVHVTSTDRLTWLHVGRRDRATVEAGPLDGYQGIVCHDRLAMYFNYGAGHVLCNAHILRSLNELLPNHRHQPWAQGFIDLITDTKKRVDAAKAAGRPGLSRHQRRRIRRRWNQLCDQAAAATPAPPKGTSLYGTNKDARALAAALTTHRDQYLAYTADFTLPFDNNQAERDLRMIKLQAKISGEFRSAIGATRFATIRSYISTLRKQTQNPHRHLHNLFTPTGPRLPPPTQNRLVTLSQDAARWRSPCLAASSALTDRKNTHGSSISSTIAHVAPPGRPAIMTSPTVNRFAASAALPMLRSSSSTQLRSASRSI
jgi:transposase